MSLSKKIIALSGLEFALSSSPVFAANEELNSLLGMKYGPNLSYILAGNTPVVWGPWLPQAYARVAYDWIEPLYGLNYGQTLEPNAAFMRFSATAELSPFYGGFTLGLGFRPFRANPQVETKFVYENYTYFKSNVEMTLADSSGTDNIADTWNADHITDDLYNNSAVDFMQDFSFQLNLDYSFGQGGLLGIGLHYTLVDINTQYDGKSYDYVRNMPVFSRDIIFDFLLYGYFPLTERWAASASFSQSTTGYSRSSDGTYLKESVGYAKTMLGPSFNWNKGADRITLLGGFWTRDKERHYDGSFAQEFLVHLQYQGSFGFPVKAPED